MLVAPEIQNCACFVYATIGEDQRPVGTAFFVGVPLEDTGRWAGVLATALHVVANVRARGGTLSVRVNTHDGGSRMVPLDDDAWIAPDQSDLAVDVVIYPWPFSREVLDFRFIGREAWLNAEISDARNIGVGDDLFFTGLFVNHQGKQRNVPVVRVGNIASMPGEPVRTRVGLMDAYLVEARSVGGLSGSPVFVSLGDIYRYDRSGKVVVEGGGGAWYLLGIMHGHWEVARETPDAVVDDGLEEQYVNMGIAIVTPISKIVPLLNVPEFRAFYELALMSAEASSRAGGAAPQIGG